jgi:hypothetical protein
MLTIHIQWNIIHHCVHSIYTSFQKKSLVYFYSYFTVCFQLYFLAQIKHKTALGLELGRVNLPVMDA